MTYFVGIDIAKYFHVATIIDHQGVVFKKPFEFKNNIEGFNFFYSQMKSLPKSDIVVGFESTAHYHENLMNSIANNGYSFKLLNPILTSRFRGINIRDVKNDSVDAQTIALFLLYDMHGKYTLHTNHLNDLYHLIKERDILRKKRATERIRLTAHLDRVFPELKPYIGNTLYTKGFSHLLKEISSAQQFTNTRIDRIHNLINKTSNFYAIDKVKKIKRMAQNSVGFHSESLTLSIKSTILQLDLIKEMSNQVQSEIISKMKELNSPIMQIPGIGYTQGAALLSIIGDINRFDSAKQLVAFAGLDPRIRQSGQFEAKQTRMSKRGSKILRYYSIWSAHNCVKNSKTLKDFYLKKRNENKSHYNALGHCAKKLLHYAFYILKNPDKEFSLI